MKDTLVTSVSFCSYMDTEQYEDAVRDYEKVYQTEKTKGEHKGTLCVCTSFPELAIFLLFLFSPTICFDLQPNTPSGQCGETLRSTGNPCLWSGFSLITDC